MPKTSSRMRIMPGAKWSGDILRLVRTPDLWWRRVDRMKVVGLPACCWLGCPIRNFLRVRGSADQRTLNWLRTASGHEVQDTVRVPDEIQKDLRAPERSAHLMIPLVRIMGPFLETRDPFLCMSALPHLHLWPGHRVALCQ